MEQARKRAGDEYAAAHRLLRERTGGEHSVEVVIDQELGL